MEGQRWLVLSRRPGESVMIGDSIEVKVQLKRKKKKHEGDADIIKVLISAPRDVRIFRKELSGASPAKPVSP